MAFKARCSFVVAVVYSFLKLFVGLCVWCGVWCEIRWKIPLYHCMSIYSDVLDAVTCFLQSSR